MPVDAEALLDEAMSLIAVDLAGLRDRIRGDLGLLPPDAQKLCSYARVLATVAKNRSDDDDTDVLPPEELAARAEQLVSAMRRARR